MEHEKVTRCEISRYFGNKFDNKGDKLSRREHPETTECKIPQYPGNNFALTNFSESLEVHRTTFEKSESKNIRENRRP